MPKGKSINGDNVFLLILVTTLLSRQRIFLCHITLLDIPLMPLVSTSFSSSNSGVRLSDAQANMATWLSWGLIACRPSSYDSFVPDNRLVQPDSGLAVTCPLYISRFTAFLWILEPRDPLLNRRGFRKGQGVSVPPRKYSGASSRPAFRQG